MKTTIRELAKAAGVSVATASMALNGRDGVSQATKEKVLNAARKMHYVPNYSARSLVMKDSNCIGLLIPDIQNPFYNEIVEIMTRIVEERGYTLLLGITNNSSSLEAEYTKMFVSRRVLGVIIAPMLVNNPNVKHLDILRAADIPIVFCTEIYDECQEPVVMCDFEKGEYAITKLLLDKGLRDFWYVSINMNTNFERMRYQGYLKALRESSVALNEKRRIRIDRSSYQAAYNVTDQIIADLPEAVICINDIMTMAIIKRMTERGMRIPQDVSIVGFDDIMFSQLISPPLTTVRQPLHEICERTMALMERKLAAGSDHAEVERGKMFFVSPKVIVRETTI